MSSVAKIPISIYLEPFKVTSSEYMRPMILMFFRRNWWWFILPVAVTIALMVLLNDVRWLIVGLMLVFMVFPMILALIYFNYALTIVVRWSLMEKSILLDDEGLHLDFVDKRMRPRTISWRDIASVTRDDKAYYFNLTVRRYTFVLIPCNVIIAQGVTEQMFKDFIRKKFN